MLTIGSNDPRLVDLRDDFHKGHEGHVCQLGLLFRKTCQPPDHQEGIADVPIWRAMEVVHAAVDDLTHLVHEEHHLLFQNLGRCHEVPNVAKADDGFDLGSRNHGVDPGRGTHLHILANNLGPSFAKAQGQQSAKLDDGLFQHDRLHGLLVLLRPAVLVEELPGAAHFLQLLPEVSLVHFLPAELHVPQSHRLEGIVFDGLHLFNHALDGIQKQLVSVRGEGHRPDTNSEANEEGLQDTESSLGLRVTSLVKGKEKGKGFAFLESEGQRGDVLHLGTAELHVHGTSCGGGRPQLWLHDDTHSGAALLLPNVDQPVYRNTWQGRNRASLHEIVSCIDAIPNHAEAVGIHPQILPQEALLVQRGQLPEISRIHPPSGGRPYPVEPVVEAARDVHVQKVQESSLHLVPISVMLLLIVRGCLQGGKAPRLSCGVVATTPGSPPFINQVCGELGRILEISSGDEHISRWLELRQDDQHDQHENDDSASRHVRELLAHARLLLRLFLLSLSILAFEVVRVFPVLSHLKFGLRLCRLLDGLARFQLQQLLLPCFLFLLLFHRDPISLVELH
mmetsp:Transcript_34038/g.79325  ORF Transcript_34038/g.79325 Transcript_34038/m.79325 type:complete len:564 (+) Transcript_34038:741-2432(+)